MVSADRRPQWGGKRAGAGRPELGPEERHDKVFLVRMRLSEIEKLRHLAAAAEMTIGVYAREILRRELERRRDPTSGRRR